MSPRGPVPGIAADPLRPRPLSSTSPVRSVPGVGVAGPLRRSCTGPRSEGPIPGFSFAADPLRPRHRRRCCSVSATPSPLPRSATGGSPVPGIAADPLRLREPPIRAERHPPSIQSNPPPPPPPPRPHRRLAPSHRRQPRCLVPHGASASPPPAIPSCRASAVCTAPSHRAEPVSSLRELPRGVMAGPSSCFIHDILQPHVPG
ncbi:hypothetical protein PVAP13_3NG140841 [Panicum virgatum]|uniref:Uncharacterized protein n=1 Tax=Panicum virgatum TaxID=38727 RepID=A0A8T0UBB9_PANVG|nr:hypothetical protein PVAP13_3NG140841 [Panicum virgatum]